MVVRGRGSNFPLLKVLLNVIRLETRALIKGDTHAKGGGKKLAGRTKRRLV